MVLISVFANDGYLTGYIKKKRVGYVESMSDVASHVFKVTLALDWCILSKFKKTNKNIIR